MAERARTRRDGRIQPVDVLVIGSGAAGLRAAIALAEQGARVLVLGKRPRNDSHTVLAAGGINAALGTMDPQDTWYIHAADTLREGDMIGDPVAVEILCREAPRAIDELVRYGVPFARGPDGRLLQRFFGAHRYRRTCFVDDWTGRAIVEALLAEADRRRIPILEGIFITGLLTASDRVNGALGFQLADGEPVSFQAGAVIVATGGHTFVYRRSTARPRESTGDGMAFALRVGARLGDMEFVQFHPTGMVWPEEAEGKLVTEAVRGEGGRLYNALGERFMARYDPRRMELSTRDRVALAIYCEIVEGRGTPHGGVWLDISHVPAEVIRERLPNTVAQFQQYGIDITRQPMEVAPTAHYSMGGVRVEPASQRADVPGLYATGEVTCGVHGANRLGGNSLTECIVFGRRAGEAAGAYARTHAAPPLDRDQVSERLAQIQSLAERVDAGTALRLMDELRRTMWSRAGLLRDAQGLCEATALIERLHEQMRTPSATGEPSPAAVAAAFDLESMLLTSEATVRAALLRTESRGAHQRRDFPHTDPAWQRRILIRPVPEGLELTTETLPPPPPEVAAALETVPEFAMAGRLIE